MSSADLNNRPNLSCSSTVINLARLRIGGRLDFVARVSGRDQFPVYILFGERAEGSGGFTNGGMVAGGRDLGLSVGRACCNAFVLTKREFGIVRAGFEPLVEVRRSSPR